MFMSEWALVTFGELHLHTLVNEDISDSIIHLNLYNQSDHNVSPLSLKNRLTPGEKTLPHIDLNRK